MTLKEKRVMHTLQYFLPRPRGRKSIAATCFMQMATFVESRNDLDAAAACCLSLKEIDAAREFYRDLGVLSWTQMKNGKTRYLFDIERAKALVKQCIERGIAANDEHVLWSIHSPSYGCYMMPLKRIFPEFRKVTKTFWGNKRLQAPSRSAPGVATRLLYIEISGKVAGQMPVLGKPDQSISTQK